jgi:hypothetical protein
MNNKDNNNNNNKRPRGQLSPGEYYSEQSKRPVSGTRNNTNNTNNIIPRELSSNLTSGPYFQLENKRKNKPVIRYSEDNNTPNQKKVGSSTRPSTSKPQRRQAPTNSVPVQRRALPDTSRNIRNVTVNDTIVNNYGETNLKEHSESKSKDLAKPIPETATRRLEKNARNPYPFLLVCLCLLIPRTESGRLCVEPKGVLQGSQTAELTHIDKALTPK